MKLLVVDDDEIFLVIAERVFRGTDIEVLTATAPDRALACLDADPAIDVLVTDINLNASIDGFQLAQAAVERVAGLRVIYLSGLRSSDHPHLTVPGPVLLKPVEADEFQDAVLAPRPGAS